MEHQFVLILDFGGQYNQLIARRVRECGVYCEVHSHRTPMEKIRAMKPVGIIFTGGPNSVYDEKAPACSPELLRMGVPVLGICYGNQLMAQMLGGHVAAAGERREYGRTESRIDSSCPLFAGMDESIIAWMSHGDYVERLPEGFRIVAHSHSCAVAGMADEKRQFYGVQFHPEVLHTQNGTEIIRNFLTHVCGCSGDWSMGDYARQTVESLRAKIGDGKVLLALSGGVDSTVAAALLSQAVGRQLTCIFVDHGLLRKNEGDEVEEAFRSRDIRFIRVNAADRFLRRLNGVRNLSGCARRRPPKSGRLIFWFRAPSIPMSSNPEPVRRPPSKVTTTWADCRKISISGRLSSRCGCFSRTRSALLARN